MPGLRGLDGGLPTVGVVFEGGDEAVAVSLDLSVGDCICDKLARILGYLRINVIFLV